MPTIDESIQKIDAVICRHLDSIEGSSRGAISQDILEQLTKFVDHIVLKFYADATGENLPINEENIAKALEYAQVNSELSSLYKFHDAIDKRVLRRSLLSLENLNCQVIVSRSGIVGQFQIRVDIPVERLLPLSYHDSPNQRIGSGIRENSRYS